MTPGSRHRRAAAVALAWALLVATADVAVLALWRDTSTSTPSAPSATAPAVSVPATAAPAPSTTTTTTEPPAVRVGSPTGQAPEPPEEVPPVPVTMPAPPPPAPVAVVCHSDLPLAEAPDAPYNFLCTRDGVPVTWPSGNIRLYASGLSTLQRSALELALAQWQSAAGFTVSRVGSPVGADITMVSTPLTNNEDGYTQVHYTCTTRCTYDRADVQLAATAELTKVLWVTTILHELGHAAGLDHVARSSEVMYPFVSQSPVAYGSGDKAGLAELARVRDAAT